MNDKPSRPINQETRAHMQKLMVQRFSLSELKALCFELGVEYEELPPSGGTRTDKTIALIEYMANRRRLPQLLVALQKARPSVNWDNRPPEDIPCPYRGLLTFREEDAHLFFGRQAFTERLVDATQKQGLVAVVGPSGSGKSSVAFAGLVPALRQSGEWLIVDFRPGKRPFYNLATAILSLDESLSRTSRLEETRHLETALSREEDPLPLNDVLLDFLKGQEGVERFLLIVDQFEELYALHPEPGGFLDQLLTLADSSEEKPTISIMLTLRADFMGQALSYRPFADALQDTNVMLGPMNQEELKQVVTAPIAGTGVNFQDGLVERILDDVGMEPGNLPLLEFALTSLWKRQEDSRLTHKAYDSMGRVKGALVVHTEQIYARLNEAEQVQAKQIFMQLVKPGLGTEDTRQQATRTDLGEEAWSVVQRLAAADARLVVTARDTLEQESVELAHETLIRDWGRLRKWISEVRTFRLWQERLRITVRQWKVSNHDDGILLRGTPLLEAENWLLSQDVNLNQLEKDFINASIKLHLEEAAARQRQKKKQVIAIAIFIFTIILSAIIFGFMQQNFAKREGFLAATAQANELVANTESTRASEESERANAESTLAVRQAATAEANKLRAEAAETIARAQTLVAQGHAIFEEEPLLGLFLVLEGISLLPSEDVAIQETVFANSRELVFQWGRLIKLGNDIKKITSNPEGTWMLVEREYAPAELRHARDGSLIEILSNTVTGANFSPQKTYFTVSYADNSFELRRTVDSSLIASYSNVVSVGIRQINFSPNENFFEIHYLDDSVEIRRTVDGSLIEQLDGKYTTVNFAPDENIYTVKYEHADGELHRTVDGSRILTLTDDILWVVFIPNQNFFLVKYFISRGELRNASNGSLIQTLPGIVSRVKFSPEKTFFSVEYFNHPLQVYRTIDKSLINTIPGASPTGSLNGMGFMPGESFYVVNYDDKVELRHTVDGSLYSLSSGEVSRIRFSLESSFFIVEYLDAPGELRHVSNGSLIVTLPDIANNVNFSPNETVFFINYNDDSMELRRTKDGSLIETLPNVRGFPYFSPEETYFVVSYSDAASELRRTSDGSVIEYFSGAISNVSFNSNDSLLAIEYYEEPNISLYYTSDGSPVSFSNTVSNISFGGAGTFFLVEYDNGFSDLRTTVDNTLLANMDLNITGHVFMHGNMRVAVWHRDGRAYILDIPWLQSMTGDQASLSVADLVQIACEGPLAGKLFNDAFLDPYLEDDNTQACKDWPITPTITPIPYPTVTSISVTPYPPLLTPSPLSSYPSASITQTPSLDPDVYP